jgi:hypothetical protein
VEASRRGIFSIVERQKVGGQSAVKVFTPLPGEVGEAAYRASEIKVLYLWDAEVVQVAGSLTSPSTSHAQPRKSDNEYLL